VSLLRHLRGTMDWLARAQDVHGDRGISARYGWLGGWGPSYPETTGYIINTFLAYSRISGDDSFRRRAEDAGNWLLTVQFPGGAFPGGAAGPSAVPRVFNTGMVLFGLAELTRTTREPRFANAGRRALEWLTSTQDANGSWTSTVPERAPHAYHSRVAWGMLEMTRVLIPGTVEEHISSARKAAAWVLKQQDPDGWFRHNYLIDGLPPITHNIAYVLDGLLELGLLLADDALIVASRRGAERLLEDWQTHGSLAGGYGRGWRPDRSFRCLTGDAQVGLIWYRIGQVTGEQGYTHAAEGIARQISRTQVLSSLAPAGVRGAVSGSWPLWGPYLRFAYPNWAAKFFADLLMALGQE
jgi:hypothetical protein